MPTERLYRVLEILDEVLELPTAGRGECLDRLCGDDAALRAEVEALLDGDGAEEQPQGALAAPAFDIHSADPEIGRKIGPYRLVELLDRGGMGAVYLAERDDIEQRVALKLIRRGLDTDRDLVRRFHKERQILARLEHPHIARFLTGGTTEDNLPFFAMELVQGQPIDSYCKEHELSIEQKLRLFCKVCSAVHFAHRNLVIHRDLKPSNLLITADGEPKLLDFGIAKLLDEGLVPEVVQTASGQALMTPRYASPEQIRLEPLTTASDVYSLGVLLYELLTGLDPYRSRERRNDEVARAILEEEPERPSTAVRRRGDRASAQNRSLAQRLHGDLDSIVLQAMRKEPDLRYGSAEELARDLEMHLAGRPVRARTGTLRYRTGKFLRRNWLVLIVLGTFLGLSGSLATVSRRAAIETEQADRERESADEAMGFLVDIFRAADSTRSRTADPSAREVLQAGKVLALDLEDAQLQIIATSRLGEIFRNLGQFEDAEEMLEKSHELAIEHYGEEHEEVVARKNDLAVVTFDQQDYPLAEQKFRQVIAAKERLGQEPPGFQTTRSNLASALTFQGKFPEAERLLVEVLEERRAEKETTDQELATSHYNLAFLYYTSGELEEAAGNCLKALEIRRSQSKPSVARIASALNLLANIEAAEGRREKARELYEEALAIRLERLTEDHPQVATTRANLAAVLLGEDPERAEELLARALETFDAAYPGGWQAAVARSILGELRTRQGRFDEAEGLLTAAERRIREVRGAGSLPSRLARERLEGFLRARASLAAGIEA